MINRCRWFLTLALLHVLALLMAACSGNDAETVSFRVFGDPAEFNAYRELVDNFNEKQDEVFVELSHIPSQSEYRTRLTTDFAAGSPPDRGPAWDRRPAARPSLLTTCLSRSAPTWQRVN